MSASNSYATPRARGKQRSKSEALPVTTQRGLKEQEQHLLQMDFKRLLRSSRRVLFGNSCSRRHSFHLPPRISSISSDFFCCDPGYHELSSPPPPPSSPPLRKRTSSSHSIPMIPISVHPTTVGLSDDDEDDDEDEQAVAAAAVAYAFADAYAAPHHDETNCHDKNTSCGNSASRRASADFRYNVPRHRHRRCYMHRRSEDGVMLTTGYDMSGAVGSTLTSTTGSLDTCSILTDTDDEDDDDDDDGRSQGISKQQSSSYTMIVPRLLSLSLNNLSFTDSIRKQSTDQTLPQTPLETTGCCRDLPLVDEHDQIPLPDDPTDDDGQKSLLSSPPPLFRLLTCYENSGSDQTDDELVTDNSLVFDFDMSNYDLNDWYPSEEEPSSKPFLLLPPSPSFFKGNDSNSSISNQTLGPRNLFLPEI